MHIIAKMEEKNSILINPQKIYKYGLHMRYVLKYLFLLASQSKIVIMFIDKYFLFTKKTFKLINFKIDLNFHILNTHVIE